MEAQHLRSAGEKVRYWGRVTSEKCVFKLFLLGRYFDAMEEKRQIEIREQEERIEAFMMNRAAKVLQRAWRSVAERKRKMRGKGRGRKGKGKRK